MGEKQLLISILREKFGYTPLVPNRSRNLLIVKIQKPILKRNLQIHNSLFSKITSNPNRAEKCAQLFFV
jgi:hypothetical protein